MSGHQKVVYLRLQGFSSGMFTHLLVVGWRANDTYENSVLDS